MSTKIYTGFKFKKPDMQYVRKFLYELQDNVKEKTVELVRQEQARLCVLSLDGQEKDMAEAFKAEPRKPTQSVLGWVNHLLSKAMREAKSSSQRGCFDYGFEVTVFPLMNVTLGMYFCQDRELEKVLTGHPNFIDFHYQNQSDRDDNVSAREWSQRGRNWDQALCRGNTPAQSGFTMTISDVYWDQLPFWDRDLVAIVKHQPEFSKRVLHVAMMEVEKKFGPIYPSVSEWRKFAVTEVYKQHVKEESAAARKRLKRRYGVKDFLRKESDG